MGQSKFERPEQIRTARADLMLLFVIHARHAPSKDTLLVQDAEDPDGSSTA